MNRRRALQLAMGVLLLALTSGGAGAADQRMVFKASDVHPEGYPTVQAVENMGKKLEAATGGRLSIQMYASMQLGGEKEAIEQAQVGALQLARVSVGALGPVVDDLNVFNLPFLFRSTEHMEKVIDGPIGQELLEALHTVKNLDQARMVIVERTEHGGPLQFMELGQFLVRAGSATAIGDVQASQGTDAINSLRISAGLIVGRLQIAP